LTSAISMSAFPLPPEVSAVGGARRLTMPPFSRLLKFDDTSHMAEVGKNSPMTAVRVQSNSTTCASVSMASKGIARTGLLSNSGFFQAVKVASEVLASSTSYYTSPVGQHFANRGLLLVGRCLVGGSNAWSVRRDSLFAERFARGNAPSIGGSHEERNAHQRSSTGRKPDWRC